MQTRFRTLAFLGLAVLGGCASQPQYITAYHYTSPTGAAGRACVERCAAQRSQCTAACEAKQQACVAALQPEVAQRYRAAIENYGSALQGYARSLEQYRTELWLNSPGYYGYGPWPYYGWGGNPWGAVPYPPPPAPAKPERRAIENQLAKERCPAACGCAAAYDACFLACGGRRDVETRCIGNCPKH